MAVNRLDISEDLQDIIGAEIEGVEFASPHSAWILFNNESRLKIIGDREWGNEKDSKVYYTIIKNAVFTPPVVTVRIPQWNSTVPVVP